MSGEYYKIGEVARLLDITVRTIRYYEEEVLLVPYRTDGGTRLYTEQHINRLKAILNLVESGFSIDVVRSIGGTRETCVTGDEGSRKVSDVIEDAIIDVEERMQGLNALKKELTAAKNQVKKCKGCVNKPSSSGCPSCLVKKSLNRIEMLNLVWQ